MAYRDAETKTDDLDLITLAERFFSFFRRYGLVLTISSVAGILLGLLLYFTSPKRYSSTMLLHSFTLTNTEHINIIENWNELLKKREYDELGKEFNCDPAMLKKVSSLSASEILKTFNQVNPNGFEVEVVVSDTAILDSLQKGIVSGLENGEYIKEKLASRRSNLRQLIEKAESEIQKLDSTKKDIEQSMTGGKNSSSFIIDISNITGQMMSLNEKLVGYKEDLKFTSAVQVLHNFAKFKTPVSPKLLKLLVLGFIAGFAIGYVVSIYNYVQTRIAQRRHSKRNT